MATNKPEYQHTQADLDLLKAEAEQRMIDGFLQKKLNPQTFDGQVDAIMVPPTKDGEPQQLAEPARNQMKADARRMYSKAQNIGTLQGNFLPEWEGVSAEKKADVAATSEAKKQAVMGATPVKKQELNPVSIEDLNTAPIAARTENKPVTIDTVPATEMDPLTAAFNAIKQQKETPVTGFPELQQPDPLNPNLPVDFPIGVPAMEQPELVVERPEGAIEDTRNMQEKLRDKYGMKSSEYMLDMIDQKAKDEKAAKLEAELAAGFDAGVNKARAEIEFAKERKRVQDTPTDVLGQMLYERTLKDIDDSRSTGEAITDNTIDVVGKGSNLLGQVAWGLGTTAVDANVKALQLLGDAELVKDDKSPLGFRFQGEDLRVDTMLDKLGKETLGVSLAPKFDEVKDIYQEAKSDSSQASKKLAEIDAKERAATVASDYLQAVIKDGDLSFNDKASAQFGSALTAVMDTVENPTELQSVIAESLLVSFVPGAITSARVGGGLSKEFLASEAGKKAITEMASANGLAAGALTESMTNGMDAQERIKNTPDAELLKLKDFNDLIDKEGLTIEQARAVYENRAFVSAAGVAGLTSLIATTGTRTGAFEGSGFGALVDLKTDSFLKNTGAALKNTAQESAQEFVESGGGQVGQNLADQKTINPNADLLDSVGDAGGIGAVAGGTTAGVTAVASNGLPATKDVAQKAAELVSSATEKVEKVVDERNYKKAAEANPELYTKVKESIKSGDKTAVVDDKSSAVEKLEALLSPVILQTEEARANNFAVIAKIGGAIYSEAAAELNASYAEAKQKAQDTSLPAAERKAARAEVKRLETEEAPRVKSLGDQIRLLEAANGEKSKDDLKDIIDVLKTKGTSELSKEALDDLYLKLGSSAESLTDEVIQSIADPEIRVFAESLGKAYNPTSDEVNEDILGNSPNIRSIYDLYKSVVEATKTNNMGWRDKTIARIKKLADRNAKIIENLGLDRGTTGKTEDQQAYFGMLLQERAAFQNVLKQTEKLTGISGLATLLKAQEEEAKAAVNTKGKLSSGIADDPSLNQDKPTEQASTEEHVKTRSDKPTQIKFEESASKDYAARTKKNAEADVTIALAVDHTTPGEKATQRAVQNNGKSMVKVDLDGSVEVNQSVVDSIVDALNAANATSINIAGNDLSTLTGKYSQEQIDQYVYETLKAVLESDRLTANVTKLVSGGQTGADEAGAKAGSLLGLDTTVLAPKGFKMRGADGKDVYGKKAFTARFERKLTSEEKNQIFFGQLATQDRVNYLMKAMEEFFIEKKIMGKNNRPARKALQEYKKYLSKNAVGVLTNGQLQNIVREYTQGAMAFQKGLELKDMKSNTMKAGFKFAMTSKVPVLKDVTSFLLNSNSEFKVKIGNAVSTLTKVPDLASYILEELKKDEIENSALFKQAGITNESDLESLSYVMMFIKDFNKALNEQIKIAWKDKTNGKATTSDNFIKNNPVGAFAEVVNGEIRLNENVSTALALSTLNVMTSNNDLMTDLNSDKMINSILGVPQKKTKPTAAESDLLRKAGIPLSMIIEDVGRNAMDMMGIEVSHPDHKAIQKFAPAAFGQTAITTLVSMGIFEFNDIPSSKIFEVNSNSDYTTSANKVDNVNDAKLFVRINRSEAYENVLGVLDSFVKADSEINAVFGFDDDVLNPLVDLKPRKASTKIKRTSKKLPKKMLANEQRQNEQPHIISELGQIFDQLPEDVQFKLSTGAYGTDYENSHIVLKESTDAAGEAIKRELKQYRLLKEKNPERFYLSVVNFVNRRMGLGTLINVMNSKVHRWLVSNETWKQEIKMDDLKHFPHAVVLAFDGKIDVWGKDKVMAKFEELQKDPLVIAAMDEMDALRRGESTEASALLDLNAHKDYGKGKLHLVAGVLALAKYREAVNSGATSFESDLAIEVDGKTNGFAFSLIQYAKKGSTGIYKLLNRTGVLTGFKDLAELTATGEMDSYQLIARNMGLYVDTLRSKLMQGLTVNQIRDDEMNVIFNREIYKLKKAKEDGRATFAQEEAYKALSQDRYGVFISVSDLVGPMVDEDGNVTKAGRNYAKNPLMTWNYNAGKTSIARGFAADAVEAVYKKLAEFSHLPDTPENRSAYEAYKTNLEKTFNTSIRVGMKKANAFKFNPSSLAFFDVVIETTYGGALNETMETVFGELHERRKTLKQFSGAAYNAFAYVYHKYVEEELAKPENAAYKIPTDQIKETVLARMSEIMPDVRGFMSLYRDESIEGNDKMPDSLLRLKFTDKIGEIATDFFGSFVLDNYKEATGAKSNDTNEIYAVPKSSLMGNENVGRIEYNSNKEIELAGSKRKTKSSVVTSTMKSPMGIASSTNTGLAPVLVHNMDAAVINLLMGYMNGYNLNDAVMIHPNDANETIVRMNEAFKTVNEEYSIPDAITEMVTRVLDGVAKLSQQNPGMFKDFVSEEFSGNGSGAVQDIAYAVKEAIELYKDEDGRKEVIDRINYWGQYSLPGSEFLGAPVATEEESTTFEPTQTAEVDPVAIYLDRRTSEASTAENLDEYPENPDAKSIEELMELIEKPDFSGTQEEIFQSVQRRQKEVGNLVRNKEDTVNVMGLIPPYTFLFLQLDKYGLNNNKKYTLQDIGSALLNKGVSRHEYSRIMDMIAFELKIEAKIHDVLQEVDLNALIELIGLDKYTKGIETFKEVSKLPDTMKMSDLLGLIENADMGYFSTLAKSLKKHHENNPVEAFIEHRQVDRSKSGAATTSSLVTGLSSTVIFSNSLLNFTRNNPEFYPYFLIAVLHEAIHVSTIFALHTDKNLKKEIIQLQEEIENSPDYKKVESFYTGYSLSDPDELLTVVLTDPKVIKAFKQVRLKSNKNKTIWDRVSEILHRLLGISRNDTALSAVLDIAGKVFKAQTEFFEKNGYRDAETVKARIDKLESLILLHSRGDAQRAEIQKQIDKEKTILEKMEKGELGSSAAPFGPFSNATVNNIADTDVAVDLLKTVQATDPSPTTSEHLNALEEVIRNIGKGMDAIKVMVANGTDEVAKGNYDESNKTAQIKLRAMPAAFRKGMSNAEAYTHELVHHFIAPFIKNHNKHTRALERLWDLAKEHITYKDLIERDAQGNVITNPTVDQIDQAKEMYDYIFKNTQFVNRTVVNTLTGLPEELIRHNGFHEFLAHMATNRELRAAMERSEALNKAYTRMDKFEFAPTKANSNIIVKAQNYVAAFINAFASFLGAIAEYFERQFTGKNKTAYDKGMYALSQMVRVNESYTQTKLEQILNSQIMDSFAKTKLYEFFNNKFYSALQRKLRGNAITTPAANLMSAGTSLSNSNSKAVGEVMDRFFGAFMSTEESLLAKMTREIQGRNKRTSFAHRARQVTQKYIDAMRQTTKLSVKKFIENDLFEGQLDDAKNKALYYGLAKTDLGSLLVKRGYSLDQVKDLVTDPKTRSKRISEIEKTLRADYPTNGVYYSKHSESLANYMMTGKHNQAHSANNAYMIASMKASIGVGKQEGNINRAEALIDELATLRALNKLNPMDMSVLAQLFNDHPAGMEAALVMQQKVVGYALENNFDNNKTQMQKGYVTDITHPKRSLVFAYGVELPVLLKSGLEMVYDNPIPKDPNDPNSEKMYVLVDPMGSLNTFNAGAFSLTSETASGTTLVGVRNANAGDAANVADFYAGKNDIQGYKFNVKASIARQFVDDGYVYQDNLANPIYDARGKVTEYRYQMEHITRVEALKLQPRFSDVIGTTMAHSKDKVNTKMINRLTVDALLNDFNKYKATREMREYIVIGPNSTNPEHRELWFRLPYDLRKYAEGKFGFTGIYIRRRNIDDIFGQKELRLNNVTTALAKRFNNNFFNALNELVSTSKARKVEDMFYEGVGIIKDTIVVKMGVNALYNILSNVLLVSMEVGNPITAMKLMADGWKYASEYEKASQQVEALTLKMNVAKMTPAEYRDALSEKLKLQERMQKNPIDFLIRNGVLQTVVEDLDAENEMFSYTSELGEKIDKYTSWVPEVAVDLTKIGLMTHDTKLYKLLYKTVQMGDFVSRYAVYMHNKKEGMSDSANLDYIMEAFVDYDYATHPILGMLNKMGIVWFHKYLFRMQKKLIKMAIDKPASVLSLYLSQGWFGEVTDPYDILMSLNNIVMRLDNPASAAIDVFGETVIINAATK